VSLPLRHLCVTGASEREGGREGEEVRAPGSIYTGMSGPERSAPPAGEREEEEEEEEEEECEAATPTPYESLLYVNAHS